VTGDLNDQPSLAGGMQGCQALLNIASLGFGHAGNIISAAQPAGIERAIFISTTAIFTRLNAKSKTVRLAAEQSIQDSRLAYTILRPTMIYGSPRDRNIWRLIQFIKKTPVIPIMGAGTYMQQPVFVDDVACAITSALESDGTIAKSYNIAGQQALTYNEMVDNIAQKLDKKVSKIHFSTAFTVRVLTWLEKMHIPFLIKAEQVLRLNEDKEFDTTEAQKDFNYRPRSFPAGVEIELSYLTARK
jgi:nucleoside-diphosphate-sugar epimerase